MRAKARTVLLIIVILRTQVSTQNNYLLAKFMNRRYWFSKWNWQASRSGGYRSWVDTRGPARPLTLRPSTWSQRVWALTASAVLIHFPSGRSLAW